MRAIGLSEFSGENEIDRLVLDMLENSEVRNVLHRTGKNTLMEYIRDMGSGLGVSLRVTLGEANEVVSSAVLPYLIANTPPSTYIDIEVDEADGGGFVAVGEEASSGNEIVFSVQNPLGFTDRALYIDESAIKVAGISTSGKVILPVERDQEQEEQREEEERCHVELLRRARSGDVAAMEDLEELEEAAGDTIRERLMEEDFLTVVEGFLMPAEDNEHFASILGDIRLVERIQNADTEEELVLLSLNVTGSVIQVCISPNDLEGMPTQGMRFLGTCWLQGWIEKNE